ncbi:MAG: GNAT family acetyltransferase [Rhodobacteraceae bacterium]|nr:MAG: GNAT family acetyltransferase [Paracoccaceae bacterium]
MSEEQYIIRPFKLEDKNTVVELWKICRLTRPWNNPEKDIERKLNVQSEMFLVLEIQGSIIGSVMAAYDGHRGVINYLAVHPGYQKKGYGKILMTHVEQELLNKGCPKINLLVRSDNLNVKRFYKGLHYDEQDDVKVFGKRLIPD